jgi:CheY-like chemotaxis protein
MPRSIDVMVVDHSALAAEVTLFAVRRAAPDASTLWLKSGDLALQYLSAVGEFRNRPGGMPALILLELDLPITSGLSVLDVIRAHPATSGLCVAILSHSCDPIVFQRGDMFDADAYIEKASDHEEYCAQIERLLARGLVQGRIQSQPHAHRPHAHRPMGKTMTTRVR